MRHKKLNKRFGRNKSQRKQLIRSLVRGLFLYYRIETTAEKAKEARRIAEKLVSLGKKATLADVRAIDSLLQDRTLTRKLIEQISPLFKQRKGGYTRIIPSSSRRGDGAPLAILELTEKPAVEKRLKKKKEKPTPAIAEEKPPEKKKPEEKLLPKKIGLFEWIRGLFERIKGFFKKKIR